MRTASAPSLATSATDLHLPSLLAAASAMYWHQLAIMLRHRVLGVLQALQCMVEIMLVITVFAEWNEPAVQTM